ncbi:MAG: GNAT family N-acetyltransferase [Eubacteriales bacterium]|nr:GNAT family N-acetyltransferase [Eubacteriales bacterium]
MKRNDAQCLLNWLRDREVTRFLSDDFRSEQALERLMGSVPSYLWQLHLNRDGPFYMIDSGKGPVGFARLLEQKNGVYEIVIVLGEKHIWGKGYGTAALKKILNLAFLCHRAEEIVANIFINNVRSVKIFEKADFRIARQSEAVVRYCLTSKDFLPPVRHSAAVS